VLFSVSSCLKKGIFYENKNSALQLCGNRGSCMRGPVLRIAAGSKDTAGECKDYSF
jgi:hypothetical protein